MGRMTTIQTGKTAAKKLALLMHGETICSNQQVFIHCALLDMKMDDSWCPAASSSHVSIFSLKIQ